MVGWVDRVTRLTDRQSWQVDKIDKVDRLTGRHSRKVDRVDKVDRSVEGIDKAKYEYNFDKV